MDLCIRHATVADTELALDWAAGEGWNPGRHDAASFLAADPEGLLVGDLGGEPVAFIACVRYGSAYGAVGLYLVAPQRRGRGLGMQIWNAGHVHLGDRTRGLDAVDAQVANYARSGYVAGAHTYRYEGRPGAAAGTDREDVVALDGETAAAVDARAFPGPRAAFLRAWLDQPEARALALRRDGAAAGYGVLRRCRVGWKVGPLFAPDVAGAEALLDALVADLDEPYWLDVPRDNAAGTAMVQRRGMAPTFRTCRMYAGAPPTFDASLVFGVTSLELG